MSEITSQSSRLQYTEAFSADSKNVHVIIETPKILGRANAERAHQLVHEGIARLQQPSSSHSG